MDSNLKITAAKISYTAYDGDFVTQVMYKVMKIMKNDRPNIRLHSNWRDKVTNL